MSDNGLVRCIKDERGFSNLGNSSISVRLYGTEGGRPKCDLRGIAVRSRRFSSFFVSISEKRLGRCARNEEEGGENAAKIRALFILRIGGGKRAKRRRKGKKTIWERR